MNCLRCNSKSHDEICDDCLVQAGIEVEPKENLLQGLLLGSLFFIVFCIVLAMGASARSCNDNWFYFTCAHPDTRCAQTSDCARGQVCNNGVCAEQIYFKKSPKRYEELKRNPRSCFFDIGLFMREADNTTEDIVIPERLRFVRRW